MARPSLDKMKKRSRELAQQESQKLKREARAERNERKKSETEPESFIEDLKIISEKSQDLGQI